MKCIFYFILILNKLAYGNRKTHTTTKARFVCQNRFIKCAKPSYMANLSIWFKHILHPKLIYISSFFFLKYFFPPCYVYRKNSESFFQLEKNNLRKWIPLLLFCFCYWTVWCCLPMVASQVSMSGGSKEPLICLLIVMFFMFLVDIMLLNR